VIAGLRRERVIEHVGIQRRRADADPAAAGGGFETACGWNGLFFGGDSTGNITAYRIDGTSLGTFVLPARSASLVLSGDNTRIAGSVNSFQGMPTFGIRSTPSP
jgi:hypothetical protein